MPVKRSGKHRTEAQKRLVKDWSQTRKDNIAKRLQAPSPAIIKPPRFIMPRAALIERCRTLIPGYDPWHDADGFTFDVDLAREAIRFFHQELCHVKGEWAGKPFRLEPWQQAVIGNLFGWVRTKDGRRRYRKSLVFVPRKNGKSPLAAAVILKVLFEGEPGAEIYGAASEYQQASLVFTHARGMVLRNPKLRERVRVYSGQAKALLLNDHPENVDDLSVYRVVSSAADAAQGANLHAGVVDELHTQKNRDLVDALETSMSARRQPLLIYITTSDYEREGSICNEMHDYASKIIQGAVFDPEFLPVIHQAGREDDWQDPKVWAHANPNLGVSKSVEYMKTMSAKAKEVPAFLNTYLRLDLNVRTEQQTRAIDMIAWDRCGGEIDEEELVGLIGWGGLDLSSRRDVTAWVMVFPPKDEGKWRVVPRFFIPEQGMRERVRKDRVHYDAWVRQGLIQATPGATIDYAYIREQILEDCRKFGIIDIGADRWNLEFLRQQLDLEGVTVVEFGQGFKDMTEPAKELIEKIIPGHEMNHGGNPVLRWMASNAALRTDPAGNYKWDKQESGDKIDGLVALTMAIGRGMTGSSGLNMYDTRDVLEF